MPLLGSRNSVTIVLAPSAAATVGSMTHGLPGTPDRWGYTFQSALAITSGLATSQPLVFNFFSANGTHLFYRCNVNHVRRKNLRVWAEIVHSLVR